jgi:hypothetical protein
VQLIIFPTPFFFLDLNFSIHIISNVISYINFKCAPFSVSVFFPANRSSFGLTSGSKTKCRCGSERETKIFTVLIYDSRLLLFSPEIPYFWATPVMTMSSSATSCSAFSLSAFFSGKKNFVLLECFFAIFIFPATDSIYSCIIAHTTVCRS